MAKEMQLSKDGVNVYPLTKDGQVFMSNGKTLKQTMEIDHRTVLHVDYQDSFDLSLLEVSRRHGLILVGGGYGDDIEARILPSFNEGSNWLFEYGDGWKITGDISGWEAGLDSWEGFVNYINLHSSPLTNKSTVDAVSGRISSILKTINNEEYVNPAKVDINICTDMFDFDKLDDTISRIADQLENDAREINSLKHKDNELSLKVNEFEPLVEQIPSKADMDGHYDGMSVGAAENLIGKGNPYEGETFTTRVSGGSHEIEDGIAEIRKIKGNTLKWSQLISPSKYGTSKEVNGVTFTNNGDCSWTINGTSSGGSYCIIITSSVKLLANHKYLITSGNYDKGWGTNGFYSPTLGGTTCSIGYGKIYTPTEDKSTQFAYNVWNGKSVENIVIRPQIFDLTEIFGSGNEPTSAEAFVKLFPNSYYPYSETKLLNFLPNSISSKGRNLWNETWEGGAVNLDTGIIEANANYIRSKEYIPIVGNPTKLRVIKEAAKAMRVLFYDGSFKYLGYTSPATSEARNTINVTSGAKYVKFYYLGSTYNNNISLFYDLTLNDYEPYEVHEMPLHIDTIKDADGVAVFPNGLLSAGTAYDEITKTHAVERVAKVVFNGTEDWTLQSVNANGIANFYTKNTIAKGSTTNLITMFGKVQNTSIADTTDEGVLVSNASGNATSIYVRIQSSKAANASAFKTYLQTNPIAIVVEMATPKVIEFASELNLDYEVFTNGVEELKPLTDENGNPTTSPIIADIVYGIDYVNTIESNKARIEELERKVAALLAAINTTSTTSETE